MRVTDRKTRRGDVIHVRRSERVRANWMKKKNLARCHENSPPCLRQIQINIQNGHRSRYSHVPARTNFRVSKRDRVPATRQPPARLLFSSRREQATHIYSNYARPRCLPSACTSNGRLDAPRVLYRARAIAAMFKW